MNDLLRQIVLPPDALKTELKSHNSVHIRPSSQSAEEEEEGEEDKRSDTMYLSSSSYLCVDTDEVRSINCCFCHAA